MVHLDYNHYTVDNIDSILQQALQNGIQTSTKKIEYYNIICAFDIETTSFIDEGEIEDLYEDHSVFEYLKKTKIKINDKIIKEFPECEEVRRSLFPFIIFSKTDGIAVDSLYHELCNEFPYYFNEDAYGSIYDQLEHIIDIFNSQRKTTTVELIHRRSVMYIWQFAINGHVIVGRTWSEFVDLIDTLVTERETSKYRRLLVYVHNLQFELEYIAYLFKFEKVFAIDTRKPIYAITESGIEFRCSYILTNYSLATWAKNLNKYHIQKLVGDLDYDQIRHYKTPLTAKELDYCIYDVLIVSAGIQEKIDDENGRIYNIPLTCTGYCRRFVRHNCLYAGGKQAWRKQFRKYNALMKSLTLTLDEYMQLKRAFQGGFTHASSYFSGELLEDVSSIDFTSSYPFVCLSEQFPMSKGRIVEVHNEEEFEHYLNCYCCVFDVKFTDIKPLTDFENYISISKCYLKEKAIENNGRLVSASMICTTITDVDFNIIRKCYTWSDIKIGNFRIYKRGYLPIEIIKSIIELYQKKTTLKGVAGKETEYLVSKGLLNSIYGMMVTDIVRDIIEFNEGAWSTTDCNPEEEIEKYNNSRKRFTYFPWGIFVTSYARANLWRGIKSIGSNDVRENDYIYSDTDSIKMLHKEKHQAFIDKYNDLCEFKLKRMCEHYGLDYEKELLPKTIKGETKPLGVFDDDGHYKYFKTLRAKAYVISHDGKDLSLTVSGVNKKIAVPYLLNKYDNDIIKVFSAFKNGLELPPEATGKLTHYYLDNEYSGTITDYQGTTVDYYAHGGIYLEKASYVFDLGENYINFLKGVFYTK